MTDSGWRPSPQRLVQSLAWVAVAAAFGHLFLSTTRQPAADFRGWFAVAGAVSAILAGLTWSGQGKAGRFVSAVAATATALLAVTLIASRLAHETGVVLLGGALNAALATISFGTGQEVPVAPDRDSL